MITEKQISIMRQYYLEKSRAMYFYEQAMNSLVDELTLSYLFLWQWSADDALALWHQIKEENQVKLTLIGMGFPR